MIFRVFGFLIPLVLLSGCSAPLIKGDSARTQKLASFPKVGIQSTASVGSLAVLHADYTSRHVFKLTKSFTMPLMFVNKISVSAEDGLVQSEINGVTFYCTQFDALISALAGPVAKVCFKSTSPGKFSSVSYPARGNVVWIPSDISPEIEFTSQEIQAYRQASPMKRELIYDGNQNDLLQFSERIYEKSLATPSRVRPIVARVSSVPMKVNLNELEINILGYSDSNITFEVINPWK